LSVMRWFALFLPAFFILEPQCKVSRRE
jgi:hypothetical protein